jgi:hypothetical protein
MTAKEEVMRRTLLTFVLAFAAATGTARAQDATRWGVAGSFAPSWKIAEQLSDLLIAVDRDAQTSAVNIQGSEFRIGVVHGRELGGDWSLSLVRKRFRDSNVAEMNQLEFFDGRRVVREAWGFSYDLNDVTLTGIEYQRFRPFATIKERVQVGLSYGGGVGWLGGQARGIEFDPDGTRQVERQPDALFSEGEVGLFSVMDYTLKPVPLARLELSVAGLVLPGVKVRASSGFNFPGYQVGSLSVVYLFGSR